MTWIKVRTNLHEDPRVLCLSSKLGVSVHHAVGMLVRLWSYADQHSTDGLLRMVSCDAVDNLVGQPHFHEVLALVGWLEATKEGVLLPRYEEHNGQTAKHRAQAALRAKRSRNGESVTRGEESRGEKSARAGSRKGGGQWM